MKWLSIRLKKALPSEIGLSPITRKQRCEKLNIALVYKLQKKIFC